MKRNPKQPDSNSSSEEQEQAITEYCETWLNHLQAEAGAMSLTREQFHHSFVLSVVHVLLRGSSAPRDELVDDGVRLRYLKHIMSEEAAEKDIELLFAIYCEHRDDRLMPFPDPDQIPDSIRRLSRKDWRQ